MDTPATWSTSQQLERREQLTMLDPSQGSVFVSNRSGHTHAALGELRFRKRLNGFQSMVILLNGAAVNCESEAERNGSAR